MITAIIQARLNSSRLKRKILLKIQDKNLLQHLFSQLSYSRQIDKKIIATTIDKMDNEIEEFAKSENITCFRGNSFDVLDRYYQCAKFFHLETIVRISGDAPLIDPSIVDKTIQLFKKSDFEYVNNFSKNRFPIGTEVEVFSFSTLEKVWLNATKHSEREHVTSYIYNNPGKFSIGHLENTTNNSNLHWSVDRIEDLEFVKEIYENIKKRPILLDDILKLLKKKPFLLDSNKNIDPHEGYKKSLLNDHE
jgi:spore coat polysaccharide biosynthesis protein SpsF (cytidylyltransferase family)